MAEQSLPTYTLDDFREVLTVLNDPGRESLVLDALKARKDEREAEMEVQARQQNIASIAELHTRANGSDSNIEGVYQSLEAASSNFLKLFPGIDEPSPLEELAAHAAATSFIFLAAQKYSFNSVDMVVVENAGIPVAGLIRRFKEGVKIAWGIADGSAEDAALQSVETLNGLSKRLHGQLGQEEWRLIVNPPMRSLRQVLHTSGVELRQLNDDGTYDDEENL